MKETCEKRERNLLLGIFGCALFMEGDWLSDKLPHHGSSSPRSVYGTGSLYRFIQTFMPKYAVISVGTGNTYDHPHTKTLDLLDDADVTVYRTDLDGDITVRSDGKSVSFETSK